MTFEELSAEEVRTAFPCFYHPHARFFEGFHQGEALGFVGVRPLGLGLGELEVYVHPSKRAHLTKGIVLEAVCLPEQFGFKATLLQTSQKRLISLFGSMAHYGILYLGLTSHKHLFIKVHHGSF